MANTRTPGDPSLPPAPPEAWEPLLRLARLARRPLDAFLRIEAASGLLLLFAAGVALLWANSPWRDSYTRLWQVTLGLRVGGFIFDRSLAWFVNDVLMAIFFFVVGLEIRRELHHGELSQWRRAVLPLGAALGGMVVPASIYLLLAGAPNLRSGWGIPMATDIAFALGVLALLGKRVPPSLRVLLLALAVIDDLGAIVVIALFYSSGISMLGLAVAAAGLLAILVMQRFGVRSRFAYLLPGVVAWAGIYAAGIHPTIAGVLIGLLTPVRAWLGPVGFQIGIRHELDRLSALSSQELSTHTLSESLRQVDRARRETLSPTEDLIETLHPWVAFIIMPVFALANAGVSLAGSGLSGTGMTIATGVGLGLLVGKPLGVLLAIGIVLRLRIGTLPAGLCATHLVVLGLVAGIGFTMALFIAQLAFVQPEQLAAAKVGILLSSAAAGVLALLCGRLLLRPQPTAEQARSADEAECPKTT